jgi:hypothetical protein
MKTSKFQHQQFPVGTVAQLSDNIGYFVDGKRNNVITVRGVVKNGPDNYLLQSMEYSASLNMFHSYHINHVEKIIKSGTGRFIVEKVGGAFTFTPQPMTEFSKYICYARDLDWIVLRILDLNRRDYQLCYDLKGLTAALMKQSFIKKLHASELSVYGHVQNVLNVSKKKKIKRFILQNCNRFLLNARKEQDYIDEDDSRYVEESFNQDMDFYDGVKTRSVSIGNGPFEDSVNYPKDDETLRDGESPNTSLEEIDTSFMKRKYFTYSQL